MAPGLAGTLFVSIPRSDGSVLALLDDNGQPRPGWPITVKNSTSCGLLLPVADGSVRVVCSPEGPYRNRSRPILARAFDSDGRSLAGWPVDLGDHGVNGYSAGRVIGDELTVFAWADMTDEGARSAWIMTVAATGVVRKGSKVRVVYSSFDRWAIGPDGVAYGSIHPFGQAWSPPKSSELHAVSFAGIGAGFPVDVDGLASGAAFDALGQIHMIVNKPHRQHARTLVFDPNGRELDAGSGDLGILAAAECTGIEGSCEFPAAPLVGPDGTTFVIGASWNDEADTSDNWVAGLGPSGRSMAGWPHRYDSSSQTIGYSAPGDVDGDFPFAAPALGPGNVVYLIHEPATRSAGSTLVAVGPNGKVRPGWPVELKRPGSEFWKVVVGSDGTVYALAIEPESSTTSSATILAIAPDSTVLWTTTIIEP